VYLDERAKHLASTGGKTDALLISLNAWRDKDGNARCDLTADGIRQAIYRISERYGIDGPPVPGQRRKRNLHPHTMRHTATTKLRETLVNPEEGMRITGHSTSAMLDWYSHPSLETIKVKMNDLKY
jgi:integrase